MNPSSKSSSSTSKENNEGPLTFEKVWMMFQETDKKFKETSDQIKETSREITRLERQFTSMWGKLVESLVEGDLIRMLNERGIAVERTQQRVSGRKENRNYEFDIIAVNGNEIVIVEVKTTLKSDNITHFITKLGHVREWLPEFHDKKIYGAVAYIHTEENVITHALNSGLLVIRATGNSACIVNDESFKPKLF